MRKLKHLKLFEAHELDKDQQDVLNDIEKNRIRGQIEVDPTTGLINVEGTLDLSYLGLKDLKGLKFGKVTQSFFLSHNELIDLEGCPISVGNTFDCSFNKLITLKGSPEKVGEFRCKMNGLESLEYGPKYITNKDGNYYCDGNPLKNFEFLPIEIGERGVFACKGKFNFYGQDWNVEGMIRELYRILGFTDFNVNENIASIKISISYINRALRETPKEVISVVSDISSSEFNDWIFKNIDLTPETEQLFRSYSRIL